jgi:hypothetical protein
MEFVKSKVGKDPASIVAEFLMPSKKKVLKHYENVVNDLKEYDYCVECGVARVYWRLKCGDFSCYVCQTCAMKQTMTYDDFLKVATGEI